MLFLASFLVLAGVALAQQPDILAAERTWVQAITTRDAAVLAKILDDQLIYAHATGIVDTKQEYIAKVTSGRQKYEGVDHESTDVRLFGDTAVVHARMHMWGVNPAGKFDDRLMMMHVWVKKGGAWQLVAHQTARLP